MKRYWLFLGMAMMVLLLTACGTPQVVEKIVEKEVEKVVEVVVTQIVETEKIVEVAPAALKPMLAEKAEGATVITDPQMMPNKFQESPMLAERVKAGTLPPVEERLPKDPLVLKPLEGIGKFGGTIRTAGEGSAELMARVSGMDKLIYWDATGTNNVPSVAKTWELSADAKTLTFTLREGMKWSDGQPFTTDDILFWFEDIWGNKELTPIQDPALTTAGGPMKLEVVDKVTVKFIFADPFWNITDLFSESYSVVSGGSVMNYWLPRGPYYPAHYVKKFHAKYVAKAELDKMVAEAKVDNWVKLLESKVVWSENVEYPVLAPWITVQPKKSGVWLLERNPYFWEVDTDGNQLPYVDKWTATIIPEPKVIQMRTIAGEHDFQFRQLVMANLPALLKMQSQGNYAVYLDPAMIGQVIGITFNQSYEEDAEIAKWLRTPDFRRALSLALDRDQFNEAFYFGLGVPGSNMTGKASPENPGEETYRKLWSTYDVKKANEMLDKLGLDKKDGEGFRLRTDGKGRLTLGWPLPQYASVYAEAAEMSRKQWAAVGINMEIKPIGDQKFTEDRDKNLNQIQWAGNWGAERMWAGGDAKYHVLPADTKSNVGVKIGLWYVTNGKEGMEPQDPELKKALDLYRAGFVMKTEERNKTAQEIWKIVVDQQYSIGIIGQISFWPRVVSTKLGNVPKGVCFEFHCRFPSAGRLETFYWKE